METIRAFFRKHILWVGILAALIPLLTLLVLQYRSLSKLQATLPAYQNELFKQYLSTVNEDIYQYYMTNADQNIAVPLEAIKNRKGGIIQSGGDKAKLLESIQGAADYFKGKGFKGGKRFFLAVVAQASPTDTEGSPEVFFYDPEKHAFDADMNSRSWQAVQVAFAPYVFYVRSDVKIDPRSQGLERDPENPMVIKPVLNDDRHIVALAGMLLDWEFFFKDYVPEVVNRYLPKYFPDTKQDTIVTIREWGGEMMWSTQPYEGKDDQKVMTSFSFVFKRWGIGVASRQAINKEWARRNFYINLSLSLFMTLLLIAGITLTLRTASREMKLSQMKTDFVSNVSHELRTPLSSIRVFSEFMRLGRVKDDNKVREYGEYIETESRRLTRLIDNILDFSKIESGRKTYHFAESDLVEVVSDTLRAFEVRLQQSGFVAHLEIPDKPLPKVVIDHDAIAQALMNLMDNAVKYSDVAKKIIIQVDRKDEYATISVTDFGIGIPKEERDKVFGKFYRVSTGLVHDVKGTGLGLAIVKHIVEAHHGLVTITSKVGAGTTFTLYIPLHNTADVSTDNQKSQPTKEAAVSDLVTNR